MSIPLYDVTVGSYLQSLGAVCGFLEKGSTHCRDNGIDLDEVVDTRLFHDMQPFRFQLVSVAHHSLGALRGMQQGVFTPPPDLGPLNYTELQAHVAEALEALRGFTREEVNALQGRDMVFELGERKLPFTTDAFALTFSLPNLHFHATTAYDILRMKGVPLGKRDYLGQIRVKE